MRYSRTLNGPQYIPATAVVMAELIKFIISLLIFAKEESRTKRVTLKGLISSVFGPGSSWKEMTVPAILYFIQNNLQYVAVTLLDAATFQVTYQLKIITTALFSVLLLHRALSFQKWAALGLLTIGIAIVQLPQDNPTNDGGIVPNSQRFIGLASVLLACLLSGLAGVWYKEFNKV
jgi:UDP-sugar transporter A1/2/3